MNVSVDASATLMQTRTHKGVEELGGVYRTFGIYTHIIPIQQIHIYISVFTHIKHIYKNEERHGYWVLGTLFIG